MSSRLHWTTQTSDDTSHWLLKLPAMDPVQSLHQQILGCTRCADLGYIPRAAPVVAGLGDNRIMLIGQAPGITELDLRRPFAGRAGKVLFRWMASIGIGEDEFRAAVYMTAVTKCFPGRVPCGSGDRRPSGREIALCRPWLQAQLELVRPRVILPVGGLAIEGYFPKVPLNELIGRRFTQDGVIVIPLPHPSGASRWLNAPAHKELLSDALALIREAWDTVMLGPDSRF